MWDVSANYGNMFWTPTIRALGFMQESDEERIQKFQDNPILITFLEEYPDVTITQELKYTGKHIHYTHTNGTTTVQLTIWDTGHNVNYSFSCHNTETGLDSRQSFLQNSIQLSNALDASECDT